MRVHDHLAFFSTSPRFDVEEFVERSDAVFVRVDAVADLNDEVTSLTDSVRVVVVRGGFAFGGRGGYSVKKKKKKKGWI